MPAALSIHRLSARIPARAQPVAARLALQALGADLEAALPASLPPQALLWLRRLRLQAPEAALLRPAPVAWRQGWVAAGRDQLEAALAHAARPALGPVPDSAEAVLFADAAEMLACLALAAQAGQLGRWWWRGLLGAAWPQWQLGWSRRPEAQAAALRLLARAGQGGVVEGVAGIAPAAGGERPAGATDVAAEAAEHVRPASAWEADESAALHGLPMPCNDVPHMAAVVPQPPASVTVTAASDGVLGRMQPPQAVQAVDDASAAPAPAPDAAPQATVSSSVGVLAERPAVAREAPAGPPASGATALPSLALAQSPSVPERPDAAVSFSALPRAEAPQPCQPGVLPPSADSRGNTPEDRRPIQDDETRPPALADACEVPALPAAVPRALQRAPRLAPAPQDPPPAEAAQPEGAPAWPWPQALVTRQAPLLFIVNALLEDGLYPDFTQPRDPGLPVPLWALLEALAQVWRLPPDPLQALLAQHAPDTPPHLPMPAAPGVQAGDWVDWLPAYARRLRQRLCRRLGMRPAQWQQALTLARLAQLWVSEAAWVAEFDLGAHDVAWRLAGLDRDPGWLPSTGVSLRFRFG